MSADSFLVLLMRFSYLVKQFNASGYSRIDGIYSEYDLRIRDEVRSIFEVCSSIGDDTDFFFVI